MNEMFSNRWIIEIILYMTKSEGTQGRGRRKF